MGLRPKLTGPEPQVPDNYDDLSAEEKGDFWDNLHSWHDINPGYCFRNNWWSWRPIASLIEILNITHNIGIPMNEIHALHYNAGEGVSDKGHCEQLAMFINEIIENMQKAGCNKLYSYQGNWFDAKYERVVDPETLSKLNNKYGLIYFQQAELDGELYHTYYASSIDNLKEFALFLENCNGFAVH